MEMGNLDWRPGFNERNDPFPENIRQYQNKLMLFVFHMLYECVDRFFPKVLSPPLASE